MLEKALSLFSEVQAGEAGDVLLMLLNLFLLLIGYYILKTVREPLILVGGGAEMKSYASAAQAVLLMGFIPFYSWFSSRVDRMKLITGVALFFAVNLELFYVGALVKAPYLGFVFFVWLGIFNLAIVAQFWSCANDIYSTEAGERLFPIIAVGATLGSPVGAWIAGKLFDSGFSPFNMMHLVVGILIVHVAVTAVINSRQAEKKGETRAPEQKLGNQGGFKLVLKNDYILMIAVLLILLNVVNTTGEYILGRKVLQAAAESAPQGEDMAVSAFIGRFYADFFLYVNIITFLIQAFVVSRIVKYTGMIGVLFALPIISFGAYGLIGAGAGFAVIRWVKTAENSTDYSVMNTAKAMLWLPTTREEKYQAKQAVDTFFVRLGDVMSAGMVFVGTTWLHFQSRQFALFNVVVIVVWMVAAWFVYRKYRRLTAKDDLQQTEA